MKLHGSIYEQESRWRVLAVYGKNHDITVQPWGIGHFRQNIVHATYKKGGVPGSIDIYLLKPDEPIPETVILNKEFKISKDTSTLSTIDGKNQFQAPRTSLEKINKAYDIGGQIQAGLDTYLESGIRSAIALDVLYFCGDKFAKKGTNKGYGYIKKIIPITKVKEVTPTRLIDGGKSWFVPECIVEANIDFSKGCETGWVPISKDSTYDETTRTFTGFISVPWAECEYCYAAKRHKNFPKTFHKVDPKHVEELLMGAAQLEYNSKEPLGRPIRELRFGKRTEAGSIYFRNALLTTLEAMIKTKTRGIFPTKLLEFDKEVARLLKRTKTNLFYSSGFDDFAQGTVLKGKTSEWRKEQLYKFRELGVNAIPYIQILAGDPPTKEDLESLAEFEEKNIPVQLLPMRFYKKDLFQRMSGRRWEDAKQKIPHLPKTNAPTLGGYEYWNGLVPIVHAEWIKIIKDNNGKIRMCHHDSQTTYCGKCFHDGGTIGKTVHIKKDFKKQKKKGKVPDRSTKFHEDNLRQAVLISQD